MFTRASTATYFDKDGILRTASSNVPRMDYDPITKALNGLRMEGARTNLFARSGDLAFTGTGGTGYASGSRSVSAFPGLLSGAGEYFTTLLPNNANACYLSISSSYTFTAGMTYTVSGYVIIEGMPTLTSVLTGGLWSDGINRFISMDTVAGAVSGAIAGKIVTKPAYKVGTIMGRDVLRWEITFTPDLTTNGNALQMYRNQTVMDGVTPAFHAFGLQFEVGAGASSYIPTSGTAVTRAADNCLLNPAGWYNATEGTWVAEGSFSMLDPSLVARIVDSALDSNNRVVLGATAAGASLVVITGGVQQMNAVAPGVAVGATFKVAARLRNNDFALCLNGGAPIVGSGTRTMPPAPPSIGVGTLLFGGKAMDGHLKKLLYFPTALSDAQLQALTT